jgi:hypothetical protein
MRVGKDGIKGYLYIDFDDWVVGNSISHGSVIYIEGAGLIPVENKSKTCSPSFSPQNTGGISSKLILRAQADAPIG